MIELAWMGSTVLPQNDALEFEEYGAGRPVKVTMRPLDPTESYLIGGPKFIVDHLEPRRSTVYIPMLPKASLDFSGARANPKISYDVHVYHLYKWAVPRPSPLLRPLWVNMAHPFGWLSRNLFFHDTYKFPTDRGARCDLQVL